MADDGESTSVSHIPNSMRALRACLNCRLLQQTRQWQEADCPNGCRWDGSWQANTTPVFKGVLAMMQPEFSWVARWQKQDTKEKGLYAMQVVGGDRPSRARETEFDE